MSLIHSSSDLEALKARVLALRADSVRRWGTMSVDQMMRHLNVVLEMCMGRRDWVEPKRFVPIPRSWLTWLVLTLPWPKGARTAQAAVVADHYDLETERQRCLRLLDDFAARPLATSWPEHFIAGKLTGKQYSRLQHKHVDHHLKQFSA